MKLSCPKPSAWPFLYWENTWFFSSFPVWEKLLTAKCRLRGWFKHAVVHYNASRVHDKETLSLYFSFRNKEQLTQKVGFENCKMEKAKVSEY